MESVNVSAWLGGVSAGLIPVSFLKGICIALGAKLESKKEGGENIMKRIGSMVSVLVIVGSLAGSALASDGVVAKEESTDGSYCHMKFPAIRERTLAGTIRFLRIQPQAMSSIFMGRVTRVRRERIKSCLRESRMSITRSLRFAPATVQLDRQKQL